MDDRRRLERQLISLRWIAAAFGAAQVGFAIRDVPDDPGFVLPLGAAILIGLIVGNLLLARALDVAGEDRLATLGTVAFALDAASLLGLIHIASDGPADPVWVIGYLLPLEGAVRWGLPGAMVGAALFTGAEVLREITAAPGGTVGLPVLAFRAGMAFVVAAVVGAFAASLRTAVAVADDRAHEAEAATERAQEAAERERQARAEVAAFHAAVLVDPDQDHLRAPLQAAADAIARELGCDALGVLVRRTGTAGEPTYVALGIFADPGYLPDQVLYPASDPVAAAAEEGEPVGAGDDLVAPMRVRGRIVGAIHEHTSTPPTAPPASPDPDRLRLLSRLADQLGLVLESSRMRADQDATVARLRELDQMKSDFVAITSHELRTPLAGVRGFVDMLRRRGAEVTPAEREEYLDIVLIQTDRLIALVDDLLVVSRIEAGKLTLEPEDIDVPTFVERFVRTFGERADRVRVGPSPAGPDRMLVDQRRLAQILTNLVHNALKFSPEDAPVDLSWDASAEGTVTFHVRDRGAGIPQEERELIFERFHQSESSISHSQGFGLGLYITKQLAEAMGGWIDVASAEGGGTVFSVTLPAARPMPAPAPPSAAMRSGRTAS